MYNEFVIFLFITPLPSQSRVGVGVLALVEHSKTSPYRFHGAFDVFYTFRCPMHFGFYLFCYGKYLRILLPPLSFAGGGGGACTCITGYGIGCAGYTEYGGGGGYGYP